MRVKTSKYNPAAIGGQQGPANISFTGPLILHADPLNPKHAATKRYVDGRFGDLNAGDLKEGLLSVPLLPSFTGDVSNSVGSNIFTLGASGVTLGTYTKVTVDDKGRVVSGGSLENEDIPNLSWNKVIRNKPSNLNGYGVQGALPISGGTVGPTAELRSVPTDPLHAVNREFVDSEVEALGSTASPGTVFRFSSDKTPEGFLRCSGGELDKLNYSNLYSVIGDKYSVLEDPTTVCGQPWKNQQSFNNNTQVLGTWSNAGTIPTARLGGSTLVTKNRVYLFGGQSTNLVFSSSIDASGNIGTWKAEQNLPVTSISSRPLVIMSKLYLIMGNGTSALYSSIISDSGNLGDWNLETSLPEAVNESSILLTKSRLYVLGGRGSSKVFYSDILADGSLGPWVTDISLPGTLGMSSVLITGNKVYLIGGLNSNKIYKANIFANGHVGSWSEHSPLPVTKSSAQLIATKSRVFLLGGFSGNDSRSNDVITMYCDIDSSGNLGSTWTTGNPLFVRTCYNDAIVTSSKIYIFGGASGGGTTNIIQSVDFTGGRNSYMDFYKNSKGELTPAGKFKLPDHTHLEDQNTYYYIKY